jgi:regulator of PEP synthase PpsR (kinase-PPPase family)
VIDVTRRSIEETAFAIVKLCNERIDAAALAAAGA